MLSITFQNMSEEEKLRAGLKPLLAKDKRQSLSPSLSHAHTHRQTGRKALRGTINYSSYLFWAVRDSLWHRLCWSANPKGISKTNPQLVYTLYTSIAHSNLWNRRKTSNTWRYISTRNIFPLTEFPLAFSSELTETKALLFHAAHEKFKIFRNLTESQPGQTHLYT